MPLTQTQRIDQAVAEVFSMMLGLSCLPAAEATAPAENTVIATVAFSGCVRGVCVIGLGRHTAEQLTERLLGTESPGLSAEDRFALLADTVGELCNMIAGGWKSRLRDGYACCALGPPQVSTARPPEIATPRARVYRCYILSADYLEVELSFYPEAAA